MNDVPPETNRAATVGRWHWTGREFHNFLLKLISESRRSISIECYIFAPDEVGARVRDALTQAAARGVSIRLMVDALGSAGFGGNFWRPLLNAGGQVRLFNPISSGRIFVRNHRKLFIFDEKIAGVGGFNVAREYVGDGVHDGWADCALTLEGPAVAGLMGAFEIQWRRADESPVRFAALSGIRRKSSTRIADGVRMITSQPGAFASSFATALREDIRLSRDTRLAVAYFLPGVRLRRAMARSVESGGRIRLLLPGKSDVSVALRAARYLYARLLRAGLEIYEYQPQILHTKLYVFDHAVYAGSSNLDTRSLRLNHELMLRLTDPGLVKQAAEAFDGWLANARRIEAGSWKSSRSLLEKTREKLAFWLLARVDPFLSRQLS